MRHALCLLTLLTACGAPAIVDTAEDNAIRPKSPWCDDKAYLDVHAHADGPPTAYTSSADFFAELDVIQADALANDGSVNLIVNLDSARWFSERRPNPYDRIVLTGIVRPQARNHGQLSIGGHSYPVGATASGDPLSHVGLFASYGVRAIKLLAKHNSHTGLEGDPNGDVWVGHCGDWDTGAPRTLVGSQPRANYQIIGDNQINRGPARTYCADYDDDEVFLGADENGPTPTFVEYFREAARHGLSVVVHGEEQFMNERTGTSLMGHESLTRALATVRADTSIPAWRRSRFEILMLHGPNTGSGVASEPEVVASFAANPGLYWEIGGATMLFNIFPRNGDAYVDASPREKRRRQSALRSHLDPDGNGVSDLADRMMFGVDGAPGQQAGLSSNGYHLARDTFTGANSPVPNEALDEVFCRRAARFLRLE